MLNATRPGRPPVRLYFDKNSGLLVRMVRYAETPVGRNATQIDYADYREMDGVKSPVPLDAGAAERPLHDSGEGS